MHQINLFIHKDMLRKLIFISSISALLLALVVIAGCNRHKENSLETVLEMAGSNRQNLENVLRHFESDSTGLAAAKFLIRNMHGHISYKDTVGLGRLNLTVDSCVEATSDRFVLKDKLDSILAPVSNFSGKTVPDLQYLDEEALINHIETALRIWKESPWGAHLNFDEFCEWLLPYKVQEFQPIDNWLNYLSPYFNAQLDLIECCDIYKNSVSRACRMVNDCMRETIQPYILDISYSPATLSLKTRTKIPVGICAHYVALTTAVMRSKGIPVGWDFTPI